ncbi:MAG TPA: polyphosphate kinase 2 family protein [Bacteroidota bacterium]|nr:polyphosphate kinase 2 family protein [Bacteroidota bacterium]
MNTERLIVPPGKTIRLKDYDTAWTGKFRSKEDAAGKLESDIASLAALQDVLYAQANYALLLIFQAMDAAGKDGAIKHVMSGVNPQGCQVVSFKTPSAEELAHDYLWRSMKQVPERGRIGIFNRSYYEEVLVVRVHPEILHAQRIPPGLVGKDVWKDRFRDINAYEQYLANNGTVILKFFLHVSKGEQKKRFLERIDTPEKNWKFSGADVRERGFWKDYMRAYEDAFNHTSTPWAPWYVIPADRKWFTRVAVADIIVRTLQSLKLRYPEPDTDHLKGLKEARKLLANEQSPTTQR